jgi:hypothetical protein
MANIVTPNVGEIVAMELMLKSEDISIHLFVNDYTPDEDAVLGSFTEMSTLGYASKTLDKDDWSVSTVSDKAVAENVLQTWTFTSGTGVYVYGYYTKRVSTGELLYCQRFGNSIYVDGSADYDTVKILPKYSGSSED